MSSQANVDGVPASPLPPESPRDSLVAGDEQVPAASPSNEPTSSEAQEAEGEPEIQAAPAIEESNAKDEGQLNASRASAEFGSLKELRTPRGSGDNTNLSVASSSSSGKLANPQGATRARKGSSVSFQEPCEVFEAKSEIPKAKSADGRPTPFKSVRYYVMLLALVSPFVVTYSRTIINFAITDMIDTDFLESMQQSHTNPTQRPESTSASSSASSEPLANPTAYFDLDNSCPVSDEDRERLLAELKQDQRRAQSTRGEKFKWDTDRQGLLKAAYSIGHTMLQIVGGRLSEIYGSHRIMSSCSLLIGICCLIAPFLAAQHFYLLFMDLFVLGLLGSFMTPALITLFSNWLTPGEKSLMLSFYLVSSRLGYALSSLLCGLLIQAQLSWRYLFYSAGWIGIGFASVFLIAAKSRPQDHLLVSRKELEYLATKNTLVKESLASEKEAKVGLELKTMKGEKRVASPANDSTASSGGSAKRSRQTAAPWLAILSSGPVWGFVITKFCVKLAGDTVQIELPSYLKRVMHFPARDNGNLNAWNYVIFCTSCLIIGTLAKTVNKRRPFGMSKTAVRKTFQSIASFGVALVLLGISNSICNSLATKIFLTLMFFLTTFSTGGEAQIPLDITERYPGTIHAIGSSIAISGAIEPILVGYLLKGYAADRERWAAVWMGASAVSVIGGITFLLLADAKIQPFDSLGEVQQTHEQDNAKDRRKFKKSIQSNGATNKAFEVSDSVAVTITESDVGTKQPIEEKPSQPNESRVI